MPLARVPRPPRSITAGPAGQHVVATDRVGFLGLVDQVDADPPGGTQMRSAVLVNQVRVAGSVLAPHTTTAMRSPSLGW
jgi:hypothetical protein